MSIMMRGQAFWKRLRTGERVLFFTVFVMLVFGFFFWLAAITGTSDILRVRDIYEGTPKADRGFKLFKRYGCRNCHIILKVGEWGLGPVLDGEGTRRTYTWIRAYLDDPSRQMNGRSLHDGKYAEDFSAMTDEELELLATFIFAQKSMPGSANYMTPPQ